VDKPDIRPIKILKNLGDPRNKVSSNWLLRSIHRRF